MRGSWRFLPAFSMILGEGWSALKSQGDLYQATVKLDGQLLLAWDDGSRSSIAIVRGLVFH